MKNLTTALFAAVLVATPALAQDDIGQTMMALDGTAELDTAAATGWHTCNIIRTGAGWGNHYVALTCTTGPFTNKWHIMSEPQKDAMLATALAAASSNNRVQVNIGTPVSGYNEIRALYLHK